MTDVCTRSAPSGLLSETCPTSTELLARLDDTITLFQVGPRTKLHREAHCHSLKHWQDPPNPVAVRFRELDPRQLCHNCEAGLDRIHERFSTLPTHPDGHPVVMAVAHDSWMSFRQPQIVALAFQCARAAIGAGHEQDDDRPPRYVTAVSQATAEWMSSWAPYEMIRVLRPVTDTDTTALLETAQALWDPDDEGPLCDPEAALAAAAALWR